MNIAYFAPSTGKGESLLAAVEKALGTSMDVCLSGDSSPQQFIVAVSCYDAVIVDCTIPESMDGQTQTESVYPLLSAHINAMGHIIVISESQLPLNINPVRGIFPAAGQTLSEEEIAKQIAGIIEEVKMTDTYPRLSLDLCEKWLKKGDIDNFNKQLSMMQKASMDIHKHPARNKRKVMISYRSIHFHEMENFAREIADTHDVEVFYLPPGSMCGPYEAHTPMRRWMLVGLLDDKMRDMDELWVYETEDYLDSWWTMAELVMLAYINDGQEQAVKLEVFNAQTRAFYETPPEKYRVTMSLKQHQRLARLMVNTRPDTMGPESLEPLRMMGTYLQAVPKEARKDYLDQMRAVVLPALEAFKEQNAIDFDNSDTFEMLNRLFSDPDEMLSFVNDDVFQRDFWENISFQISAHAGACRPDGIDIDKFLSTPMDEVTDLKPEDLKKAADSDGRLVLKVKNESRPAHVSYGEIPRHYLWLATVDKNVQGDMIPGLMTIDIYNVWV